MGPEPRPAPCPLLSRAQYQMALDWRVLQGQQAEARRRLIHNFHKKEMEDLMQSYKKEKVKLLLAGAKKGGAG